MRLKEEHIPEVGGKERTPGLGELLWDNTSPRSDLRAGMEGSILCSALFPLCTYILPSKMHQWFPSVISFMAITLGLVFGHNGDLCMPSTVGMDNESYFIS